MRARGSLNLASHIEHGFALLATQINNALGGKARMKDFMRHAPEEPATLEAVMKLMGGTR